MNIGFELKRTIGQDWFESARSTGECMRCRLFGFLGQELRLGPARKLDENLTAHRIKLRGGFTSVIFLSKDDRSEKIATKIFTEIIYDSNDERLIQS